jgi:hypothetical protein
LTRLQGKDIVWAWEADLSPIFMKRWWARRAGLVAAAAPVEEFERYGEFSKEAEDNPKGGS